MRCLVGRRGAEVTFLSRHEQLGATILYPAATVEASRERLFAGPFSFTPAVALREITPEAVVTRGSGHLRRAEIRGRHRGDRQLPRLQ